MNKTGGWGSKNAIDLYDFAVDFAGHDPVELMLEITRQLPRGKCNMTHVWNAMDIIAERARRASENG